MLHCALQRPYVFILAQDGQLYFVAPFSPVRNASWYLVFSSSYPGQAEKTLMSPSMSRPVPM